jgi:hypothetical protein
MMPAGGTDGTKASGSTVSDGSTADREQADGTVATFRAAIAEVEAGLGRMRGLRPG